MPEDEDFVLAGGVILTDGTGEGRIVQPSAAGRVGNANAIVPAASVTAPRARPFGTGSNYYRNSAATNTSMTGLSWGGDWAFDTTTGSCETAVIWSAWSEGYESTTSGLWTRDRQQRQAADLSAAAVSMRERGSQRFQEIETANSRAEDLLREHLTERQKQDLTEKKYFDVCSVNFRAGTRRYYRIHRGRAGNVQELDGPQGRAIKKFCCHPLEHVPDADTMLAQKLMLEMNEELFLKTANITDLRNGAFKRGEGIQATG